MDAALIEEITKLVIAKLEESKMDISLSVNEISDWNRTSTSLLHVKTEEKSLGHSVKSCRNLTVDEIREWEQLTAAWTNEKKEAHLENGYVQLRNFK